MKTTTLLSLSAALLLVACGTPNTKSSEPPGASGPSTSDGWWGNPGDDTSTGGGSQGEPEGAGEEPDDEEYEGDETFLWGFLEGTAPGRTGEGGYGVIESGREICMAYFALAETTEGPDCDGCEDALTVVASGVEVEESAGCAGSALDPSTLEGAALTFRISGESVSMLVDGAWAELGEAWDEEGGPGWEVLLGEESELDDDEEEDDE